MGKYNIAGEFKRYEKMQLPLSPPILPVLNAFLAVGMNQARPPEGLRIEKKRIAGYQNGTVGLTVIEPRDIGAGAPCLIYLHGGAFAFKGSPYHMRLMYQYALRTPCKVVFVDYRLMPKHAFPVGLEDCYAAFEWVCRNAEELGIDRDRIAVGGDSAGGALAAAVSLMARDRKAHGICFQMLIYPVTDARQRTGSMKDFIDTPLWNARLNDKMWKLYLRGGATAGREYASPLEAASLERLPDSYIEVAEYDCLRDEGVLFAEALKDSGVRVELNRTEGTIHGFEISGDGEIVQQIVARRIEALRGAFYPPG